MPNINRTVTSNNLTPGKTAAIRGQVTWSRIRARVEGEALKRENERLKAAGRLTKDKPYTSITVANAQIVPLDPSGQTLTAEETYALEHMFDAKAGRSYTGESHGKYLPDVGVWDQNTGDVKWLTSMEGELAPGMDVTVIMVAYEGKPNNGFGLQAVICNEPIRYFGKQPLTPKLNAYSMYNVTSAPAPRSDVANAADDIATPDEADPAMAGGMMPPPGGRPVSAPQGNGFDASQQTAGYYPPQPAAPAPAAPAPAPAPAGYYPPQPAPAAPAQPAPAPAPAGYYPPQPQPAAPAQPAPAPAPAGYPGAGPFAPPPAAPAPAPAGTAYPPYNDGGGVMYNPNEDPNRQY